MGNRYADDIIRIVGIDPNESSLEDAPIKSAILAKRGIGYVNPTTGAAESKSGTSGTTRIPASIGNGNATTGENQAGETGINPNDPQTGVIGADTGVSSATDIIDGTADSTKSSDPQVGPSGLEYANDGALNAINAEDCATGGAIQIRTRNDFIPPDATVDENSNPITNEWEDANTPPGTVGWLDGKYWRGDTGSAASPFTNDSSSGLMERMRQDLQETNDNPDAIVTLKGYTLTTIDEYRVTWNATNPPFPDIDIVIDIFRFDCPAAFGDATCPSSVPLEEFWPADGQYDLKLDEGQFVTSPFDSEAPPEYKNPVSVVPFCFDEGRTGAVEVTKDNGFMVYETSEGVSTGIIRVYDSSGHMTAFTDTTGIGAYRPEPTP